jgi:hypothetical protein
MGLKGTSKKVAADPPSSVAERRGNHLLDVPLGRQGRKAGRQEGRKAGRQEGRKAGRQEGSKGEPRQEHRKALRVSQAHCEKDTDQALAKFPLKGSSPPLARSSSFLLQIKKQQSQPRPSQRLSTAMRCQLSSCSVALEKKTVPDRKLASRWVLFSEGDGLQVPKDGRHLVVCMPACVC